LALEAVDLFMLVRHREREAEAARLLGAWRTLKEKREEFECIE
jgi:hypothetical protein